MMNNVSCSSQSKQIHDKNCTRWKTLRFVVYFLKDFFLSLNARCWCCLCWWCPWCCPRCRVRREEPRQVWGGEGEVGVGAGTPWAGGTETMTWEHWTSEEDLARERVLVSVTSGLLSRGKLFASRKLFVIGSCKASLRYQRGNPGNLALECATSRKSARWRMESRNL